MYQEQHSRKEAELPTDDKMLSIEAIHTSMTSRITNFMAAELIADPFFPQKRNLPKLFPPAFNNFGHQPLLDYKALVSIVWHVIEDIKDIIKDEKIKKRPWIIWSILIAILGVLGGIATQTIVIIVLSVVAPIAIFNIGKSRIRKATKEEIAETRAKAIQNLTSGQWQTKSRSQITDAINKELQLIGDGTLSGKKLPVIIITNNEHPFPGYGRLQAENLFICRPKEKKLEDYPSIEKVRNTISENIINMVSHSGIREVSFGGVIVVHGNSLLIDSKWLDDDKVPILWFDKANLSMAESLDQRASVRTYFATQILFPQYMTTATFFVRPFYAGNSIACQVSVTTLGPPARNLDYFLERLLKHKMEREESSGVATTQTTTQSEAVLELRLVRMLGKSTFPFQADPNISDIEQLEISKEKDFEDTDYVEEYDKIIKESVFWPGYFTVPNWRESNSFTFTTDFFGRPEAIASARTLYDQISRASLDSLDGLEFDISDYRDKEGKYSINADKIDQLVVGERIHITKTKETKESESPKTEQE